VHDDYVLIDTVEGVRIYLRRDRTAQ